jgi:hypothetical protein
MILTKMSEANIHSRKLLQSIAILRAEFEQSPQTSPVPETETDFRGVFRLRPLQAVEIKGSTVILLLYRLWRFTATYRSINHFRRVFTFASVRP